MEYQRRVVCAANRDKPTGDILLGARHWDTMMTNGYILWSEVTGFRMEECEVFEEQGFIDQYGVFMDRQEAWKVAESAGQIIRRVGGDTLDGGTLFSENLY